MKVKKAMISLLLVVTMAVTLCGNVMTVSAEEEQNFDDEQSVIYEDPENPLSGDQQEDYDDETNETDETDQMNEADETAGADEPVIYSLADESVAEISIDGAEPKACATWAEVQAELKTIALYTKHTVKIKLLQDINIGDTYLEGGSSWTVDLDLNGHTFSRTLNAKTSAAGSSYKYPAIYAAGSWNIYNGTIVSPSKASVSSYTSCAVYAFGSGTLTMSGVTLRAGDSLSTGFATTTTGLILAGNKTVELQDCSISNCNVGVEGSGTESAATEITIANTTINASKTGIRLATGCQVNFHMTGGSITAGTNGLELGGNSTKTGVLENIVIDAGKYGITNSSGSNFNVTVKGENTKINGTTGAVKISNGKIFIQAGKYASDSSVEREDILSGNIYFEPGNLKLSDDAEDGYYSLVVDPSTKVCAVLTVDGQETDYYTIETLKQAMDSAENSGKTITVKLLQDVTGSLEPVYDMTIDLNGKTLNGYVKLNYKQGVTVTLKDSSDEKTGTIHNSSATYPVAVRNEGGNTADSANTLIIEGGTFISDTSVSLYNGSTYTTIIKDGKFFGKDSVITNSSASASSELTIEGGSFYSAAENGTLMGIRGYGDTSVKIPDGKVMIRKVSDKTGYESAFGLAEKDEEKYIKCDGSLYTGIEEAINASDSDEITIKLTADMMADGPTVIPSGKKVIFDLNGFTYELLNGNAFSVEEGGTLVIQDSSADKKGEISCAQTCIETAGTVEIQGGNLTAIKGVIRIAENTADPVKVLVSGGNLTQYVGGTSAVIKATAGSYFDISVEGGVIQANPGGVNSVGSGDVGIDVTGNGTVSISGGTVQGACTAIRSAGDGVSVNMTGGTLRAYSTRLFNYRGIVDLIGGQHVFSGGEIGAVSTLESGSQMRGIYIGSGTDVTLCGDLQVKGEGTIGALMTPVFVYSSNDNPAKLNIRDDVYLENQNASGAVISSAFQYADVEIEGGVFVTNGNTIFNTSSTSAKTGIDIMGGIYNKDVDLEFSDLLTKETTYANETGYYTIGVAKIGDEIYTSLEDAIQAASTTNTTIELLTNINVRENITVPENVTITGEKTITALDKATVTFEGELPESGGPSLVEDGGTIVLLDDDDTTVTKLPTSVVLSESSKSIGTGESFALTATVSPDGVSDTDKAITWSSSDKTIAAVDADGNVTAVKKGTVIITASTPNGVKAICTVHVKDSISDFSGEAIENEELIFTGEALHYPDRFNNGTVTGFKISYQQNGKTVDPITVGTYDVVITREEDNEYLAFSQIIEGALTITPASLTMTLNADKSKAEVQEKVVLTAELGGAADGYTPAGTVRFLVNDQVVAENISIRDGSAVYEWTASGEGAYHFTAEYVPAVGDNYGAVSAKLEGYSIAKKDQAALQIKPVPEKTVGDADFVLEVTGGESGISAVYESSNTNVITVDANGTVHIVGPGTAVITVTKAGNDIYNPVSAQITIQVKEETNDVDHENPDKTDPDQKTPEKTPDKTDSDAKSPEKTSSKNASKIPSTGDQTPILAVTLLLIAGLIVVCGCMYRKRR